MVGYVTYSYPYFRNRIRNRSAYISGTNAPMFSLWNYASVLLQLFMRSVNPLKIHSHVFVVNLSLAVLESIGFAKVTIWRTPKQRKFNNLLTLVPTLDQRLR